MVLGVELVATDEGAIDDGATEEGATEEGATDEGAVDESDDELSVAVLDEGLLLPPPPPPQAVRPRLINDR